MTMPPTELYHTQNENAASWVNRQNRTDYHNQQPPLDKNGRKDCCQTTQQEGFSPIFRNLAADALELLIKFMEWKHFGKVAVLFIIGVILFYYFGSNWLAVLFSIIAVLCFIPMAFFPMVGMEFGFSAMLILSSLQGFGVGFIVGKVPNLIGHIATFQIDLDLLYEFIIYIPIAFVASLLPFSMILPVGIIITILYNIGYVMYFQIAGLLNAKEVSYAFTNCVFNILVLIHLVPLLQRLGFG